MGEKLQLPKLKTKHCDKDLNLVLNQSCLCGIDPFVISAREIHKANNNQL